MIEIVEDAEKLHDCFPVIAQLRPHLDTDSFVEQVLRQTIHNYRIVCLKDNGKVVAVERKNAHRFYEHEGMAFASHHYSLGL